MDNVDFSEDTPDGKLTTHATVVLLFQEEEVTGDLLSKPLDIEDSTTMTGEDYSIAIIPCNKPKRSSTNTKYTDISLAPVDATHPPYIEWNISRCLSTEEPRKIIPTWSGFNSLSTSASPPIVNIGVLPLINEVAHE